MAAGQLVAAVPAGRVEKEPELEKAVAEDAGVGGPAAEVRLLERADYFPLEPLAGVHHPEFDPEFSGQALYPFQLLRGRDRSVLFGAEEEVLAISLMTLKKIVFSPQMANGMINQI